MRLPSRYTPEDTEEKWYQHWLNSGYFYSTPDDRPSYSIVIPPPNVTGVLHMGHMLNNTIQDILIRKARLNGLNACWVPGTDHASIATEAKVVKMLREKGIKKGDLTREEFLKYAWEWTDKYGGIILQQLKKLGASCDWNRTAFTMDEVRSKQVTKVFVDLYNSGKLYKGLRMVNWDPEAQTVLSNEEVLHAEEQAKLYHVKYQVAGTNEYITIATQRPETIMGDTAVAVHPDDPRYQHLKGKKAIVPLVNRAVPIIFDDYVDQEFGTGALKVTPAHDPNDYEIGKRHNLEVIDTIHLDGTLNEKAEVHVGLDRFEARKRMKTTLEESGNLVSIEDYVTSIGRSERTNAVVEPKLSMQWFVDMKKIVDPALTAVMDDTIEFYPKKYKNTYRHWMENIRDWCISRQLWWGHRIPAWYYGAETFVAETAEAALELAQKKTGKALKIEDLQQDEDVLDTWFSSWLWPFSVFDGIEDGGEIDYYYPTNILVTGWDIIFVWVARMIMSGYEWKGKLPFKHVYFHGMVRDKQRRKMSKSLGNSPDALKLIADYGADGVRFGMMSCAPAGGDLLFDEKLCEQGKNFCNKMWNALRLIKGWEIADKPVTEDLAVINTLADKWFHNKLQETILLLEGKYKDYRLSEVVMDLYNFIWNDFFSWYLEIIKPPYGSPIDRTTYDQVTGYFEQLMTILHPLMPFVTEEIWHQLKERPKGEDCVISSYPKAGQINDTLIKDFEVIKDIISKIRDIRQKNNLKKSEPLKVFVQSSKSANAFFELFGAKELVQKMAVLSSLEFVEDEPANAVSFIAGTEQYYVELNLEIDESAERERILKELEYNKGFLLSVEKKLSNERFVNNAPAAVVEKERKKQADAQAKITILKESLAKLGDLNGTSTKGAPSKATQKTVTNNIKKSDDLTNNNDMESKKSSLKRKAIIHAKTVKDRKTRISGKAKLNLKKQRATPKDEEVTNKKTFVKPGYKKSTYAGKKGEAVNKLHFETDLLGMASSKDEKTTKAKASSAKSKAKGKTKPTSTMATKAKPAPKSKSKVKASAKAKRGKAKTSTKAKALKGKAYAEPIKTVFKSKVKVKASKAPEGLSSKVMKNGTTITSSVAKIKCGRKVLWERADFQAAVKTARSQSRKKKK